jgi:hypothetical protein
MGHLDEQTFKQAIDHCTKCEAKAFEVLSYLDRQLSVMLAEPNQDGRWTHDGEKFIDGVYRIRCIACRQDAYSSEDCPRCHRSNGLADAAHASPRLVVPKRCPTCRGTELTVIAFVPARVRTNEGRPSAAPVAIVGFGEPGFQITGIMCDGCDWVAVSEGCPLCGGPGPLRERP